MTRLMLCGLLALASGLVVASEITREPAALPARYGAALPHSAADLQAWDQDTRRFPPVAHALDQIADGSEPWLQRWRSAMAQVRPTEAVAVERLWQSHLQFSELSPAFCTFARHSLQGPDDLIRRIVSVPFAKGCAQASDRPLLLRPDTPARAVLAFYAGQEAPVPAFEPRLEQAVTAMIPSAEAYELRAAAFTLVHLKQAEANRALLRIHGRITDQDKADQVALAFLRSDDPQGRALAQAACQRRLRDPMCSPSPHYGAEAQGEDEPQVDRALVARRIAELATLGFSRVQALKVDEQASADPEFLLSAADYLYGFDTETGMFPNQHDSLLRRLARLAGSTLQDVVFEERYPADDQGPYRLSAYADGSVYRLEAQNYGDWYDVQAVLQLLQRVADDRRLDVAFVPLASGDQMSLVLAGPNAAVNAAFERGLLQRAEPEQAMESGKAFEAEVIQGLQRQQP